MATTLETPRVREPHSGPRGLRVLYIHGCGTFGGASRSLITMIQAFPPGAVQAFVICPSGNVVEFFRQTGAPVLEVRGLSQFDNSWEGYYRGRRWLVLLRELLRVWDTFRGLYRARRWAPFDVVHVNEVLLLLPALLARKLFRAPVVIHVRVVQQTARAQWRRRFVGWFLRRYCDAVVAIDDTVRASLPPGVEAVTVHNGFTPGPPSRRPGVLDGILRPRSEGWLRVASVGNLLALKGVYELIEAARITRERDLKVEFILVGDNGRRVEGAYGKLITALKFARDVRKDVEEFIARHQLQDRFHLVGFTPDVQQIYDNVDVLCFPSRLQGVGRPVFEAGYSRVPSIVAMTEPRPDTFVHGETGLCIPPKDPGALADAILHFHDHRADVRRMGEQAYQLARRNFNSAENARQMLGIYQRLTAEDELGARAAFGARVTEAD
jgi:glycosyltransferase involved in cell wall biosynthesis